MEGQYRSSQVNAQSPRGGPQGLSSSGNTKLVEVPRFSSCQGPYLVESMTRGIAPVGGQTRCGLSSSV